MIEPPETYTRMGRHARLHGIPWDEAKNEAARFATETQDQGGVFRAIDLAREGYDHPQSVNDPDPPAWTATLTP